MQVFTIHDSKSEMYHNPLFYRTKGEALRAFESFAKDTNSQIHQYPTDYTLVHIGEYDDSKGVLTPSTPFVMTNASEYVQQQ